MAVVIDNHLPREPLISSYVPDRPYRTYHTEHTMVIVSPLRRSVAVCMLPKYGSIMFTAILQKHVLGHIFWIKSHSDDFGV